ncbi:MAG: alpha-D-ribose 1-methylphosphonate 5-triphosphate diphosphatase [Stappiaceae bacterium]
MTDSHFTNARIILGDELIDGSLSIKNGKIDSIDQYGSRTGIDLDGDFLVPGLVELHTDHLETHYAPRPGVRWNPVASVQAHDMQIIGSGITTVFDALRVGMDEDARLVAADMHTLAQAITKGDQSNRLRADHYIHLRCEVSAPDVLDGFSMFDDVEKVRVVSLMDHTPGQRQFTSMDVYKQYYQGKTGMSDAQFEAFVDRRLAQAEKYSGNHREIISEKCQSRPIILASHDDATVPHVEEAIENKVAVAEFPTTIEAADASRKAGLKILMGAPNVVRGGSHSGNVSAHDLAEKGLLDILSSDYVPFSLLYGALTLAETSEEISLPQSIAMVSKTPAEAAGLDDRGEIAIGRRADLVQVHVDEGVPIVRAVWREGQRVA